MQLVGLFDEVDEDHDGQLHYTEFLAATLETCGAKVAEERLTEAFDQMDLDESGSISRDNLMEFLGRDSKVLILGSFSLHAVCPRNTSRTCVWFVRHALGSAMGGVLRTFSSCMCLIVYLCLSAVYGGLACRGYPKS